MRVSPLGAKCFNSRTPGGVRRKESEWIKAVTTVSIHAPREGCDFVGAIAFFLLPSFNSRTTGGVRRSYV